MRVEGTYRFPGPPEQVYDLLLDQAALAAVHPGLPDPGAEGGGAVRGDAEGRRRGGAGDLQGPGAASRTWTRPRATGWPSRAAADPASSRARLSIRIEEDGAESVVHVEGDGQLGGPMAGVAQRLLGGVASMMMDQFFGCMVTALPAAGAGDEPTTADAATEP